LLSEFWCENERRDPTGNTQVAILLVSPSQTAMYVRITLGSKNNNPEW